MAVNSSLVNIKPNLTCVHTTSKHEMGLYQPDLPLCIDTDNDNNPRIRNTTSTDTGPSRLKFTDLSTDNIRLELRNITVLEICNCDVSEIPNTIRVLNLKKLILSHNKLTEVPSCLYSGLDLLEELDLSSNNITDFQVEPACCGKIRSLNVSDNKIRDFPKWIVSVTCPSLQEVFYSRNSIIKLDVSRKLDIKKLEMCNCKMVDGDFVFLKRIKTLEFLDISNDSTHRNENRFTEINNLFTRVKWKKLLTLNLSNLTLSIAPSDLFEISSLVELNLAKCDLNWIPEEVQHLRNLEILDVSENAICSLPKHLTQLERLSVVKAAFNCIATIDEFHHGLEILDLYQNQLEDFSFCLEQFHYLDLEQNFLDTSDLDEGYISKRDEFRTKFSLNRTNGCLESVEDPHLSSHHSESDDANYQSQFHDFDEQEECWDEAPASVIHFEKNPDVTTSDDEWNGREENTQKTPQKKIVQFDVNEDLIFADAEEDF